MLPSVFFCCNSLRHHVQPCIISCHTDYRPSVPLGIHQEIQICPLRMLDAWKLHGNTPYAQADFYPPSSAYLGRRAGSPPAVHSRTAPPPPRGDLRLPGRAAAATAGSGSPLPAAGGNSGPRCRELRAPFPGHAVPALGRAEPLPRRPRCAGQGARRCAFAPVSRCASRCAPHPVNSLLYRIAPRVRKRKHDEKISCR
ncbi:uncharacterized protein LOC120324745 isoform X2 [Pipra filicauda]|uniref:Uncharacterized protein LOC120324745 isoform X2 n=1 Tax=Pipra filicauda TaxID=649802 RepID=A0A7R5L4K8_9PASS|nr:uncharacterized protein LOC120324745 isoform X2 [Pipra filicauda]